MRFRLSRLLVGLGLSMGFMLPAQAQVSQTQVNALVEALRQAAPQTATPNDGLYSAWQIKPENIPRWSQSCTGQSLSPSQFEASPETARSVVACVMQDVLQDEYDAANGDVSLAVRRAAAWWMTGDPTLYGVGDTAYYTQRVLNFYQQQQTDAPASNAPTPTATATPAPTTATSTPASARRSIYDRYMTAGYAATQQRDYDTALLYFNRALDERPNDTYAERAVQNVEGYRRAGEAARQEEESE